MFTTPCFIRKNTPELRCKLEELGYERLMCDESKDCLIYTKVTDKGAFYVGTFYINERHPQCPFDCGDNENLFLAIAALRDDSDYLQWFTDGTHWEVCPSVVADLAAWKRYYQRSGEKYIEPWKATKDELINHFKK